MYAERVTTCPASRKHSCAALRKSPRHACRGLSPAFTLVEALVATALLIIVMAAVSQIFSMSSSATGRTVAHAELIEHANAFEQSVRTELRRLRHPGLLIIESPPPLVPRADLEIGESILPFRHDRLIFAAQGGPGEFESLTDRNIPSASNPNGQPATASEALVFFGPSHPDGRILETNASISGKEWIVARRVILLNPPSFERSLTGNTPPGTYPLLALSNEPVLYYAGIDAVDQTAAQLIAAAQSAPSNQGLWDLNVCPNAVTTYLPADDPSGGGFYFSRAAFNLAPRIADLRIEWTDGSVVDPRDTVAADQPDDPTTQWFGAWWDTAGATGVTGPSVPPPQGDTTPKEVWHGFFNGGAWPPAPAPQVEFAPSAGHYRARWTPDNWEHRPRALRFTFRVYDEHNRINNIENVNIQPWDATPTFRPLRRWGLVFSFVVSVP